MDFSGKKILIFGLGRSGLAASRALIARDARVTLTDKREGAALGAALSDAQRLPISLALGGHDLGLLEGVEAVVLSPGVPGNLEILRQARQRGIVILSEIELAYQLAAASHRWVAVTGTNGKTTTTSLLAAMFEKSGQPYLCGGNIGKALADEVGALDEAGVVVAEVSSFQLEEIHAFKPEVAVITNLTPDHLDRYSGLAAYAAAKARVFENQGSQDWLVLNALDLGLLELAKNAKSRRLLFDRTREVESGAWIEAGQIWLRLERGSAPLALLPLERLLLRGPHNQENALAAAAAAFAMGLTPQTIVAALENFAGVEHRLEACGELNGVRFVNDSKATNVDSVEKALQSFNEPVHLILGGRDKEGDFTRLADLIQGHVARLYLLGEAADKIFSQVGSLKPVSRVDSMEEAVALAFRQAKPGEWVLLSPGCASFDMFNHYEHRGQVFKEAVRQLGRLARREP
jgi:UDP-N-acetylmuramoylalanine--D-glutamate ligase